MPNSSDDFNKRFIEAILSKRTLRRLTKDLSLKEMKLVLMDVEGVYLERERDEREKEEKFKRAQERYQQVSSSDNRIRKTKIRYRFTDDKGVTHEWSGNGHTPAEFKAKLKAGVTWEELEVKGD